MKGPNVHHPHWNTAFPFLLPLAGLVAGICMEHYVSLHLMVWLCLLLAFVSLFIYTHYKIPKRAFLYKWNTFSYVFSWMLFGAVNSYLCDIRNHKSWYGRYLESADAMVVQLDGDPQIRAKTIYMPASVKQMCISDKWLKVKGRIQLYIYGTDAGTYSEGQRLIIPYDLTHITNSGNPYAFQFADYAARQQLYHQVFLNRDHILPYDRTSVKKGFTGHIRNTLLNSIQQNVNDSVTRSLIEATLLNERALLNDEVWQAYSITGIAHIIAISGMHVALLFTLLLFLLYWIRDKKWHWLKYALAIPVVWLYISITGYPPSAVRAAVMFSLVALGIMIGRPGQAINTWAAAGFMLLLYNAFWLYDVGVQLSFLSVLSILIFYRPVSTWIIAPNVILRYLWNTVSVGIAAQILVFPLVLYYFHQFPLLSIIANIPAGIFSFVLMTGALLLFLLDYLGIPCAWIGDSLIYITGAFHRIVSFLANCTPESMQQLYIRQAEFWLIMAAIIFIVSFIYRKRYAYLVSGLLSLQLMVILLIFRDWQQLNRGKIVVYNTSGTTLIDVFKGKSVLSYPLQQEVKNKDYNYSLLPSRLGHGAIRACMQRPEFPVWRIGGQVVAYLDGTVPDIEIPYTVHFLVVDQHSRFDPGMWKKVFNPHTVIIAGNQTRRKAQLWQKQILDLGLNVHWVGEKGAWSLQ